MKKIRDRLSAHPDSKKVGEEYIQITADGTNMHSTDGRVRFRLVNVDDNRREAHEELTVNPGQDMNTLNKCIDKVPETLAERFGISSDPATP